jgi:hypothetical protein
MVRLLMLSGLILLLAAPTASAGVREQILRECQEGRITGNYTPGQLRDARKHIPTDIDEYSDCRDVLTRAGLTSGGSAGGGHGGGAGGIAPGGIAPGGDSGQILNPADPAEQAALNKARKSAAPVTVDGERIVPGLAAAAARNSLPPVMIVLLVLVGLCGLAAASPAVRRRVSGRRAT